MPQNVLVWDSFEAVFFVVAGFNLGLVLGLLFPSLWRSFRRGFRKVGKYQEHTYSPSYFANSPASWATHTGRESTSVSLQELFINARFYFQTGQLRDAVQKYIDILSHEQVSKTQSNQSFLELAYCYLKLQMFDKSFEVAKELCLRKPKSEECLQLILNLLHKNPHAPWLSFLLDTYKGSWSSHQKKEISNVALEIAKRSEGTTESGSQKSFKQLLLRARLVAPESGSLAAWFWYDQTKKVFQSPEYSQTQFRCEAWKVALENAMRISLAAQVSPAWAVDSLTEFLETLDPETFAKFSWSSLKDWANSATLSTSKSHKLMVLTQIWFLLKENLKRHRTLGESPWPDLLESIFQELKFYSPLAETGSPSTGGLSWHECGKCSSLFDHFFWRCSSCHESDTAQIYVFKTPPELT